MQHHVSQVPTVLIRKQTKSNTAKCTHANTHRAAKIIIGLYAGGTDK